MKKAGAASPTKWFRESVNRASLFYAGFWLITIFFSKEFVRALTWLRARFKSSAVRRIIVCPRLWLPIVVAGFSIFTSLINFSPGLTLPYA